jgi:hypothetical protein
MSQEAEAVVRFSGGPAGKSALAAARQAAKAQIAFERLPGSIRIVVRSEGGKMDALTAATMAALALIKELKDDSACIEGVRLISRSKEPQRAMRSRGSLSKETDVKEVGGRVKPQVLMGEVTSPKAGPDRGREAFRNFMTSHRLRPTIWAKEAGVSSGEILGFLTGRSRGFSEGVAEKLARVAKVRVEQMFE